MHTLFKLIPESKNLDLDIANVNRTLHPSMRMEERDDGIYVVVETAKEEDEEAQQLVQRELDRIFFLTCVRTRAAICKRYVRADFTASYRIHGPIPAGLGPQDWSAATIALQLRLWSVADENTDPPTKLLIFFQIIELSYPDLQDNFAYPKYTSSSLLHERTEAKLLRNIVSHAGRAKFAETRLYLQSLGLEVMADRSDPNWLRVVSAKVNHVRRVARDVITAALVCPTSTP